MPIDWEFRCGGEKLTTLLQRGVIRVKEKLVQKSEGGINQREKERQLVGCETLMNGLAKECCIYFL
jgi:hypothetical protein